jgi:hypothetical protein
MAHRLHRYIMMITDDFSDKSRVFQTKHKELCLYLFSGNNSESELSGFSLRTNNGFY